MSSGRSMGSHQSHRMGTAEWLTPPEIIESLGPFDLDPCSPVVRPWATAKNHYTIEDDGLSCNWKGRVWCNPPYGKETWKWLCRLHEHGNGTALIFARTETVGFFAQVWEKADAIFFFEGRLYFHNVSGERAKANAGAPSCLVAYGAENVRAIEASRLKGKLLRISEGDADE